MSDLLDHILNEDYVSANRLFESHLAVIVEKKLYEKKKMMQAEVFGGLTLAQIAARKELGWKQAADVLVDPRERKFSGAVSFKKPEKKKKLVKKKLKESSYDDEKEAEKEKLKAKGKAYPSYGALKPKRKAANDDSDTDSNMKRDPYNEIDRTKSRIFTPKDIKKAEKAPTDYESAYQHDKKTAQALHRAGDTEAMPKFKKEYRGYSFGKKIAKAAGGMWAALSEDTE